MHLRAGGQAYSLDLRRRVLADSPDLNPIELAFSKIKQALRSLAARTVDDLWSCMQAVQDRVTAADAAGSFQHCGYTLQIK